jgi:hypothetical protein
MQRKKQGVPGGFAYAAGQHEIKSNQANFPPVSGSQKFNETGRS